ncbi:outer membrane lipoprotein-sorting protein [Myxococcota bacterium]|nr:outer membrane lipoprotein-sorting protein [Myxococcota bacterium]
MIFSVRSAKVFSISFAILSLFALQPAQATDLSAQDIVDKALTRNAFGFEDALARLTLTLQSKSGHKRERVVEVRSRTFNELEHTLMRFEAPADVAGTGFLIIENDEGDDDQFLFLPALNKTKRISGKQRTQRFMGTDLTYSDLESRDLQDSTLKKLEDSKTGGQPSFVIESTPKEARKNQYSKTISWIHQKSFVILKVEFYDKRGKLLKTLKVKRLEKKNERWVAMTSEIKNLKSKTSTTIEVNAIDFEAELTEADFTRRALGGG